MDRFYTVALIEKDFLLVMCGGPWLQVDTVVRCPVASSAVNSTGECMGVSVPQLGGWRDFTTIWSSYLKWGRSCKDGVVPFFRV
jgi:hypothetical protein